MPKLDKFPSQCHGQFHATLFHEFNVYESIILIHVFRRLGLLVVFLHFLAFSVGSQ